MRTIINPDGEDAQELSPFKVHARREIVSLLRILGHPGQLVSLLVDGGEEAVITSILDVDEVNNFLVIDCASNAMMNKRIVASSNISFETVLDHIRILFFASWAESCMHDGLPALRVEIPASIIRLQRREFYRVLTPVSTPVRCTLYMENVSTGVPDPITVTLQNVSGGGIAIVDDQRLLDNTIGLVYKDCKIMLPGNTVVVTSLQVRNSQDVKLPTGKEIRRIGCLFIELPVPMLTAIQRYITKLEREQNAKLTGMG